MIFPQFNLIWSLLWMWLFASSLQSRETNVSIDLRLRTLSFLPHNSYECTSNYSENYFIQSTYEKRDRREASSKRFHTQKKKLLLFDFTMFFLLVFTYLWASWLRQWWRLNNKRKKPDIIHSFSFDVNLKLIMFFCYFRLEQTHFTKWKKKWWQQHIDWVYRRLVSTSFN